jgi:hypothetical protein
LKIKNKKFFERCCAFAARFALEKEWTMHANFYVYSILPRIGNQYKQGVYLPPWEKKSVRDGKGGSNYHHVRWRWEGGRLTE